MLLEMKRRFLFMYYPNVLVRSKTYLSNTRSLPTQVDSSTVSYALCNPESLKRKITYFVAVSSQILLILTFAALQVYFFFYFTMLLLKAFWFIANFPLFGLSCTIWYVCWLVIMELNLWACYSSNDILFLLVLFLPGLDMFYEFLSYSTGIHIWYNQNSISYLISLQRYKPKYFLFFCMMLELDDFLFNIWKHFLPHHKLKFARNPFGSPHLCVCRAERRVALLSTEFRVPLCSCGGWDEVGEGRQRVWFSCPCSKALTCLISLFCSSEALPHCSH